MKCFEILKFISSINSQISLTVNMKCFEIIIKDKSGKEHGLLTVNMKCFEMFGKKMNLVGVEPINRKHEMFWNIIPDNWIKADFY